MLPLEELLPHQLGLLLIVYVQLTSLAWEKKLVTCFAFASFVIRASDATYNGLLHEISRMSSTTPLSHFF